MQVVNIYYPKFYGLDYKAGGIYSHTSVATGEEFLYKLILTFLKTFHSEGHCLEIGYLVLGVAQGKMTKETLVVFVNLIVEQCLLVGELTIYRQFKALYNATKYGFVEHHRLAFHH